MSARNGARCVAAAVESDAFRIFLEDCARAEDVRVVAQDRNSIGIEDVNPRRSPLGTSLLGDEEPLRVVVGQDRFDFADRWREPSDGRR